MAASTSRTVTRITLSLFHDGSSLQGAFGINITLY